MLVTYFRRAFGRFSSFFMVYGDNLCNNVTIYGLHCTFSWGSQSYLFFTHPENSSYTSIQHTMYKKILETRHNPFFFHQNSSSPKLKRLLNSIHYQSNCSISSEINSMVIILIHKGLLITMSQFCTAQNRYKFQITSNILWNLQKLGITVTLV